MYTPLALHVVACPTTGDACPGPACSALDFVRQSRGQAGRREGREGNPARTKPAKVRCPIGLSHESRIRNVNKLATKCSIALAMARAVAVAVVCTGAMATLFFLAMLATLRDRVDILCKTRTEGKKTENSIGIYFANMCHVGGVAYFIYFLFFWGSHRGEGGSHCQYCAMNSFHFA